MSLVPPFDTSQQTAVPAPWRLLDAPRDYITAVQDQRPDLEATFACGVDLDARTVTTANFCGWGTFNEGLLVLEDFGPSSLMVHTHPASKYQPATGSPADLRCAAQFGALGLGFAIVNGDGTGLLVMRSPRPWKAPTVTRSKVWTWRGWTLIHSTRS